MKPTKAKVIHTVPLHIGQNIEVPMGSKITYYGPRSKRWKDQKITKS